MLESAAERSALVAAADIAAVVDVGLNFLSRKTQLMNHRSKTVNDPSTISAQEAFFDFARVVCIFATRPKSVARNRIRIIINLNEASRWCCKLNRDVCGAGSTMVAVFVPTQACSRLTITLSITG